jgi:hypothetical protein
MGWFKAWFLAFFLILYFNRFYCLKCSTQCWLTFVLIILKEIRIFKLSKHIRHGSCNACTVPVKSLLISASSWWTSTQTRFVRKVSSPLKTCTQIRFVVKACLHLVNKVIYKSCSHLINPTQISFVRKVCLHLIGKFAHLFKTLMQIWLENLARLRGLIVNLNTNHVFFRYKS